MELLLIEAARGKALDGRIERLKGVEFGARMRLIHDVVAEDGGMIAEAFGELLERAKIMILKIGMVAVCIGPEIIEGGLHSGLKIIREPARLLDEIFTIIADRPFGRPIAAEAPRINVLVHIEEDVDALLMEAIEIGLDAIEIGLVMDARLRLEPGPKDKVAEEVQAELSGDEADSVIRH